jgi:hypothetical protein
VIWNSGAEEISIRHEAFWSFDICVRAIMAALWLHTQAHGIIPCGYY